MQESRRPMIDSCKNDTLSDAQIVGRVLSAERELYAELVRRYWSVVEGFLAASGLRGLDLEEATQSTFVTTYENLHRLRKPASVGAYLITVARRCRLRISRHNKQMVNMKDTPAPIIKDDADAEALQTAVARLPDCMQVVLGLKFGEQLTASEIAERLGQSVGTVTKTLSRAYQRLREDAHLLKSLGRDGHE